MDETKQEQQQEAPKNEQKDFKGMLGQLEAFLEEYMVKKAPFAIPQSGKEIIVKIAPYLIIIFAILAVPVIIAGLGLSAILAPVAMMGGYNPMGAYVSLLFTMVAFVIEIMAVPSLLSRSIKGWNFVFYASIVSLAGSILSFNIIGGIIGAIIGWYILFQVRELYK